MPKEVNDKWQEILNKEPGVLVHPIDYLNESIRGITIPGIDDINITQTQHSTNPIHRDMGRINVDASQNNTYVGSSNPLDKINREFTVTFRMNNGLYNYFMIYETIFYRICKHELYEGGEDLFIDILNEEGVATSRIKLFQCNIDGIDGLDLAFDKIERQQETFSVTFKFNNIDYVFLEDTGTEI
jgi:hypothetical protein